MLRLRSCAQLRPWCLVCHTLLRLSFLCTQTSARCSAGWGAWCHQSPRTGVYVSTATHAVSPCISFVHADEREVQRRLRDMVGNDATMLQGCFLVDQLVFQETMY